jgi:UDP-N-acetylglucosamine 2-epimerase (hydrolysing)
MSKKILFITGTRADFGKIKPLIKEVNNSNLFEYHLFVTGMHTLSRYGYTVDEVYKNLKDERLSRGFRNSYIFMNQCHGETMEQILANTINGLSRYVSELKPKMIIVHGDRVEALAGAIVGALRNIMVAHIEGGELSGTIDEVIRHSITKMSNIHFVANEDAAKRLKQLGEKCESIFVIGSPDIDIMLSKKLPTIDEVKRYYDIVFDDYGIVLFHPVTTDLEETSKSVREMVSALLLSSGNYIVIYPNNDEGSELIFNEYKRLENNSQFAIFPSLRMEYFLTLLKMSNVIIGNSSAGIREAPVYSTYSINIESRQKNRFKYDTIINVNGKQNDIINAINSVKKQPKCKPSYHFGNGGSAKLFMKHLEKPEIWNLQKQKQFVELTSIN